jgi:hypothetical protein
MEFKIGREIFGSSEMQTFQFVVVGLLTRVTTGIYEKEAGHYDWQRWVLGETSVWTPSINVFDSFLVGTTDGIVSAVKANAGNLLWRVRVTTSAPVVTLVDTSSGTVVSLAADGSISGIDTSTGLLKWSMVIADSKGFSVCENSEAIEIYPSGTRVRGSDGSVFEGSTTCRTPIQPSNSPISVNGVSISMEPTSLVMTGKRDGKTIWSREECLSSIDDVVVVPSKPASKVGKNDLSWLIGGHRAIVALSSQYHRVVVVDLVSHDLLGALEVDLGVRSLGVSPSHKVELRGSHGNLLGLLDVDTITISKAAPHSSDRTYKIDQTTGEISGYMNNQIVWNINLRTPIVSIVELSHKQLGNVPVSVKPDASVAFKYMNPNLVTVIGTSSEGLVVTAFDSVTGAVPVQVVISGASLPAYFVACDNWIVGHYFKDERFDVIAIDLYEKREDKGFYAAATGQVAKDNAQSAYDLPVDVQVVTQQYVFPLGPVTAVAVTATGLGVTPRQVVFASLNGIYAIRKDTWLNPQRPATSDDSSLPPYSAVLPVIPSDFLSHTRSIEYGISKLVSVPTHLESTSIVVAVGKGDIFVAPIYIGNAPYDVLSPFFNYWLLFVSLAGVFVAVAITSVMAHRKSLYDKWK